MAASVRLDDPTLMTENFSSNKVEQEEENKPFFLPNI